MTQRKISIATMLPVLFGFFVMGFVDIIGVATSYVKDDFNLTESMAGLIPLMLYVWFLILGIPTALVMDRIGRKNMVQISNIVTIVGMVIPFIHYDFVSCLVAFALLGIGNTMLQVSLNPLLTNVVKGNALTSSLTTGQVIKAVSSFCGPFIAAFAAKSLGNWQYIFPIFAVITLLSGVWLLAVKIEEEKPRTSASFADSFRLLGDRSILLCFLGIVFVVGTDVGINTVTPKLLMERAGMAVEDAGLGSSVYFLCRTVGAFLGAFMLSKMSDLKYYRLHVPLLLAAVGVLYFVGGTVAILVAVGVAGYAISSLFAVIFSQAMKARPEQANNISGLMITGICGGGVVAPAMGFAADAIGSQTGSLVIITVAVAYLLIFGYTIRAR